VSTTYVRFVRPFWEFGQEREIPRNFREIFTGIFKESGYLNDSSRLEMEISLRIF